MTIEAQVLQLIREADIIYKSEATWRFKYERIFSMWSRKIKPLMNDNGMSLDWHDPDRDYQGDVQAFMNALLKFAKNLEAVEKTRSSYEGLE